MRPFRVLWILAAVTLTGCTGEGAIDTQPQTSARDAFGGHAVIAVIDTGVNPYYEEFLQLADGLDLPAVGEVTLTGDGNITSRVLADEAEWHEIGVGELYHFSGTRLYAITFDPTAPIPAFDSYGHGAAVNYIAAREAPRAVIVSIQVVPGQCAPQTMSCIWSPSMAEGMEWAAAQPWIDVITSSINLPANAPDPAADPEGVFSRWAHASELAAQNGKIVISTAGNEIAPSAFQAFGGPPWVISVGGIDVENQGEALVTSRGVDVVSNFTEFTPSPNFDGTSARWYGTSFAAPVVAGTLASAVAEVREANPDLAMPEKLRAALNASALLFEPSDATRWRPVPPTREDPFRDTAGLSLPILTQAQMGWGYVNSSLAPEIARRVLEGDLEPPAEKDQAILVQAQYQRAREEYWANWPR